MADPISLDEFRVDLKQLQDAIGTVKREHGTISETMASVADEFARVKDAWDTPSEQSFDAVQAWLLRVTHDLENILQDSIGRMQQSYDNYRRAEEENTKNVTPHGGGGGGGGGSSHKKQALYTSGGQQDPTATEPLRATERLLPEAPAGGADAPVPMNLHSGTTPLIEPSAAG